MEQQRLIKNQQVELSILRYGMDAAGVASYGGQTVFVPGALPGERVTAQITKVEKRHAFARVQRVLDPSPARREPPCPLYPRCGGCSTQHMDYAQTLAFKQGYTRDCLQRIGGLALDVPPVAGAADPWHYRNKSACPVTGSAQAPAIGFYAPRSHRVIDQQVPCAIAQPAAFAAQQAVRRWIEGYGVSPYDETRHQGCVRHVVTRTTRGGDVMVILVGTGLLPSLAPLLASLREEVAGLRSVQFSPNPERTNVILGKTCQTLWGEDTLVEPLKELSFRLSPFSFFQVNPAQTDVLYDLALSWAELTPQTVLVDAYCGAGTLSLIAAGRAGSVIGLEIVPEAVADAQHNAAVNHMQNATFVQGAVEHTLPRLLQEGIRPGVLLLDPPRKGCAPQVLEAAAACRIPRLVYISCNPATLARDAALLGSLGYRADAVQPVDMFCWTGSVECVMRFVWEGE